MIEDWRSIGVSAISLLIVQLPNMQPPKEQPSDSPWAEFREAQAQAARTVPNTGLAVTIDLGQADDIHRRTSRKSDGVSPSRRDRSPTENKSNRPARFTKTCQP
jgi:hypothetical protein